MTYFALGLGIGTQNSKGEWLEVYYPAPLLNPSSALVQQLTAELDYNAGNACINVSATQAAAIASALKLDGSFTRSERPLVLTILASDDSPANLPEAYLKLQLLSHRLVKPHGVNLSGMFGVLPNVAWTSEGAIDLAELPARQLAARLAGERLSVDSVDKFPKMTDYVVPSGTRIADTARIRLGAYLGEGTTVMHEGFVNFNAGTAGPGMIEGRISAGVFVGSGSDLGGGCSTMGTLSGGGNIVISVGENCLIGANAGIGIPLGDRCTVESGLYVTPGSVVALLDDNRELVREVKARDLTGQSDLLFRRNSKTGRIECLTNKSAVALNEALHTHN